MAARRSLRSLLGQPITVSRAGAPGGPRVRMAIDAAEGEVAVLRPLDADAKAFAGTLAENETVEIGAAQPDGYVTAEVKVRRWSAHQRMLLVSNPPSLEFLQRRETYRVPVGIDVLLAYRRGNEVAQARGRSVNVSIGGLAAVVEDSPPVGDDVVINLAVAPGEHLVVVARVLERGSAGAHPARFMLTQLSPGDRRRLAAFLRRAEATTARIGRRTA